MHKGESWRSAASDPLMPVAYLSRKDALQFCQYLTREFGGEYRLPTEAEWEFACRAGTSTLFSVGDTLTTAEAAIRDSDVRRVKSFAPNPFGLFDMHGLKYEYCSDAFAGTPEELEVTVNPHKTARSDFFVSRGGGLEFDDLLARSAARDASLPTSHSPKNGMRIAASIEAARIYGRVQPPTR